MKRGKKMSREIKFRIWDKKSGMWLKCFNVNLLNIGDLSNVEIMQYTGVKDKNRTEIYEGDIVKWRNRENDVFKYAKVFFEDGAFRLYNTYFELNKYGNLEVVGNIYENPEICCK